MRKAQKPNQMKKQNNDDDDAIAPLCVNQQTNKNHSCKVELRFDLELETASKR